MQLQLLAGQPSHAIYNSSSFADSLCVREKERQRDNLNFTGLVSFVLFTSFLLCHAWDTKLGAPFLLDAIQGLMRARHATPQLASHASHPTGHASHAIYNSSTLQRVCVCMCEREREPQLHWSSQSRPSHHKASLSKGPDPGTCV